MCKVIRFLTGSTAAAMPTWLMHLVHAALTDQFRLHVAACNPGCGYAFLSLIVAHATLRVDCFMHVGTCILSSTPA